MPLSWTVISKVFRKVPGVIYRSGVDAVWTVSAGQRSADGRMLLSVASTCWEGAADPADPVTGPPPSHRRYMRATKRGFVFPAEPGRDWSYL